MLALDAVSFDILEKAVAPSTKQAYNRAWSKLERFAAPLSISTEIPLSIRCIRLFVSHLSQLGTPPTSISSFLSAISYYHKLRNAFDPTQTFVIKQIIKSLF